jgi:hypothetical protein
VYRSTVINSPEESEKNAIPPLVRFCQASPHWTECPFCG